jgi:hypothetical protein
MPHAFKEISRLNGRDRCRIIIDKCRATTREAFQPFVDAGLIS